MITKIKMVAVNILLPCVISNIVELYIGEIYMQLVHKQRYESMSKNKQNQCMKENMKSFKPENAF